MNVEKDDVCLGQMLKLFKQIEMLLSKVTNEVNSYNGANNRIVMGGISPIVSDKLTNIYIYLLLLHFGHVKYNHYYVSPYMNLDNNGSLTPNVNRGILTINNIATFEFSNNTSSQPVTLSGNIRNYEQHVDISCPLDYVKISNVNDIIPILNVINTTLVEISNDDIATNQHILANICDGLFNLLTTSMINFINGETICQLISVPDTKCNRLFYIYNPDTKKFTSTKLSFEVLRNIIL